MFEALPLTASRRRHAQLRADLVAGVVVGVVALPLSIALAIAVGVSPLAGLYTAVFAGAVASLTGGSRFNITGPTAALTPLLHHVALVYGVTALPLLGLMSGVILLGMSALRFGRLVRYMPGLVIVGFTAGIGISIALGQVNALLAVQGTDPTIESALPRVIDTFQHLQTVGLVTPMLGLGVIVLLIVWPRAGIPIPAPLVAVVLGTLVALLFGLDTPTVESRYGAISGGLPTPDLGFIDLQLAGELLPSAFALATLGAVESLLSAVVADGMAGVELRHDSDLELRGQGLGNIASAVMGGIPATAAIARTATGIRSGGLTRLTGVSHAATVLIATLALAPLVSQIPLAVLAAVLIVVAWNIADVPEIAKLVRAAPRDDLAVLISTIAITVLFDLTYAIGFGVLTSTILLLRRLVTLPAAAEMLPDDQGHVRQVTPALAEHIRARPDIVFFNAQGILSFHSAAALEYQLLGSDTRPLVLRMKDVHYVDATGLLTLTGVIEHRRGRGARTVLTAVQPDVARSLDRFGIFDLLGPGGYYQRTRDAIDAISVPATSPPTLTGPLRGPDSTAGE